MLIAWCGKPNKGGKTELQTGFWGQKKRIRHFITAGVAAVLAMSLAGYASTNPKKVDEANWKQAKSNNTIEAYLKYLRNANSLYRAHEIEAKTQLKSLMQADLASVREVAVTNEATAVVGRKLTSAGLVKLVSDALQRQGYHVVESDVPNRVIVSLSGKHFLSGTASSYWHFGSAQGGTLSC